MTTTHELVQEEQRASTVTDIAPPEPEPQLEPGELISLQPVAGLAATQRASNGSPADPLGGTQAPADVVSALQRRRGQGRRLPAELAHGFGEQLGADFEDVRVHADGEAGQMARAVQAQAFTHGSDIYFAQGTYAPTTSSGQHLIAHELTHVVQQGNSSGATAPTIGRADDPAEHEADRVADGVVSALQRSATAGRPARVGGSAPVISRWPWSKKKPKAETPKAPELEISGLTGGKEMTAEEKGGALDARAVMKKHLTDLVAKGAPDNRKTGRARMVKLRELLTSMDRSDREAMANDDALMAKARTYVGAREYISLLAAVGMYRNKTKGGANKAMHMTGAEADTFIQTNIQDYPHLKGYIAAAVKAGKKGEGFIATVGDEDWAKVYEIEFPEEAIGSDDELTTNAFASTTNADQPAILHHDRGTRSTAIHESMHRYATDDINTIWGFDFNEGVTEYFTRVLTDREGKPAKDGGKSRNNYQDNWEFVKALIRILGADRIAGETTLAEMNFNGKANLLKTRFVAAWKAKSVADDEIETKWADFDSALRKGDLDDARDELP